MSACLSFSLSVRPVSLAIRPRLSLPPCPSVYSIISPQPPALQVVQLEYTATKVYSRMIVELYDLSLAALLLLLLLLLVVVVVVVVVIVVIVVVVTVNSVVLVTTVIDVIVIIIVTVSNLSLFIVVIVLVETMGVGPIAVVVFQN